VLEYKEESANVGTTTVRYELTADGNSTMLRLASFLKGEQLPEWGKRYSEVQQEYSK
jgi:hypothetical protein